MLTINEKLSRLKVRLKNNEPIRILIVGLGSVGNYLLDYLVSLGDPQLEIIVAGRNRERMQKDVNIVRTAATIRRQLKSRISIETVDLNDANSITAMLRRTDPHFLVNSSRVYAGLKYGSISWHTLRAYGVWTPLSVQFAANIIKACIDAGCNAVTINTSYSDAVIPWIKSALGYTFDFGSGNLNHLIPRMKFYIAEKFGITDLEDIDITLATSHFHDVVISKEGHSEGEKVAVAVRYDNKPLYVDVDEMLRHCSIPMPVDQKRNMMNASSNFDIIHSTLRALREEISLRVHTPGVYGETGGYPCLIDGKNAAATIDTSTFTLEEMREANRRSIYHDGILGISGGELHYTPELLAKVKENFGCELPADIPLNRSHEAAHILIDKIINPSLSK